MRFVHPAFMAALFLAGLYVAGWGGPARALRLRGAPDPATARRHSRPGWAFAALVAFGWGGGLAATYELMPYAALQGLHFTVGSILLGLLAALLLNAHQAHRGRAWAYHAHPLLATTFLLLYLVQLLFGLQMLGYAPVPGPGRAARVAAAARPIGALALLDVAQTLAVNPEPDESAPLQPFYAICPQAMALPAQSWTVQT